MMHTETTLSNKDRKLIRSLASSKGRRAEGLFVAEGHKLIADLLPAFTCELMVATRDSFLDLALSDAEAQRIGRTVLLPESYDFSAISSLKTPRPLLALFRYNEPQDAVSIPTRATLLLDSVQDPGNVGTILRTADWFGIRDVWCTEGTADCFAPKVVQATMGALARIKLFRIAEDSSLWASIRGENIPVVGAFLEGKTLSQCRLPGIDAPSIIVMGNEGNGISATIAQYVTEAVTIPPGCPDMPHVESLNVAIATAVILSRLVTP